MGRRTSPQAPGETAMSAELRQDHAARFWQKSEPSQGTSVTPSDFSGIPSGSPLCASGSTTDSATSYALLAMYLNQDQASGVLGTPWTAAGTGIRWDVRNPGGSPLELEIGSSSGEQRWCSPLDGSSGVAEWGSFTSDCQGGQETAFDGVSGLDYVGVRVPGQSSYQTPFDFCIDNISPLL